MFLINWCEEFFDMEVSHMKHSGFHLHHIMYPKMLGENFNLTFLLNVDCVVEGNKEFIFCLFGCITARKK